MALHSNLLHCLIFMLVRFANKKIIDPEKIVKILKDDQNQKDYLIHLRQAPPYELLASEYKWFLYTYKFLVEVDKDVVINIFNIVAYDQDSVFLEDSSVIQLTPQKVELLKYKCLQLDCGDPDHESHYLVIDLSERIEQLQQAKINQENDPKTLHSNKIDENAYKKL